MADRNTSIRASQLRNGTVTDKDIQDDSLTGIKFVDVTISGGKIAAGAISESKLDIVNSPVDGYYLKYTAASGMEWFAGGGGVSDHGSLTGLTDDDHTQYLLTDGTRTVTGDFTVSGSVNLISSSYKIAGDNAISFPASNTNIAIGHNSGHDLTTGSTNNVSIGADAMYYNETGDYNIAIGRYALRGSSGSSPSYVVAIGHNTGLSLNTTQQYYSTYIGTNAGRYATSAIGNVGIGHNAHQRNQTGNQNVVIGYNAGSGQASQSNDFNALIGGHAAYRITTGDRNQIIGYSAGYWLTTGSDNVLMGNSAGQCSSGYGDYNHVVCLGAGAGSAGVGNRSICIGYQAGTGRTGKTHVNSICVGYQAGYLLSNDTGAASTGNVCIGYRSGYSMEGDGLTTPNYNVVIGSEAAHETISGSNNVIIGRRAGHGVPGYSYDNNTIIGYEAGYTVSGTGNVFVGYKSGYNEIGYNKLYISNSDTTTPLVYGEFDNTLVRINGDLDVTGNLTVSGSSPGGGVSDHGALTGLTDDDHTQYLLASGTRNISGNITQDNGFYIATDEIRARDSGGLNLKDDSGTSGIFIEDGGKVGIGGITNPTSSLDVKTTFGHWNSAENRGAVRAVQAEYVDWSYYNGSGWSYPMVMSDLKSHLSVGFMDGWVGLANTKTNSLEAVNIGVGVSGPTEKLEVGTDTDVSAIIGRAHIGYDGAGADQAMFSHVDTATANNYSIKSTNLGATMINVATGQSIYFRVNNSTVASLSASELLMSGAVRLATDEVRARSVTGLHLKDDSGTSGIFIKDGGRVGIDTTTPSGKLHVGGSHIFTDMGYGFMSSDTEGNLAGMYVHTDDSLRLITNATPRLTISEAGNIDITGNLTLEHGTAVNEFSTDTTLSGNSDDAVPTEKAVKTYVDSATGTSSGFRAYLSAHQALTTATWTKILCNTESYDNQSEYDNATNYRFTAKIAGTYFIHGQIMFDDLDDGKVGMTSIYVNGALHTYGSQCYGGATPNDQISLVACPLKMAVGDYVELWGYHNHGSNRNAYGTVSTTTIFAAQKMTAASEHGSAHENSSYVKVSDTKSAGTAGGTFTQDAWQTRVLNTEDNDPDGVCSLSSNQITLAAGTYECRIFATAFLVDRNVARLRNVTGSTTVLAGIPAIAGVAGVDQSQAIIVGRFTIAASQALEVQHRCYTTNTDDGFGYAANYGENEVYTIAEFWKISEDGSGSGPGFSSRVSVSLSANQTGVAHATWTKVELNTEQFDGLGEFNTSTHLFTPNTNGYYQVNACIGHEGMGDGDTVQTAIYKNSARIAHASIDIGGTASPGIAISKMVYLTTSDTVSLWGRHTLGVNGAFDAGISETYLTIHRVS